MKKEKEPCVDVLMLTTGAQAMLKALSTPSART